MDKAIDLRSDTVTTPSEEMRRAMAAAAVGDDVYGEDPTVRELEETAASLVGKEAGLFVASGTMGNQVAILTHTRRGDEVIAESESHVFYYEVGGMAVMAGVQVRQVPGKRGVLDPRDVEAAIRDRNNIHFPRTSLLCIENTHNRGGGSVTPVETMDELCRVAHENGLKVHLDGARIFNAATALGVEASRVARDVDSVMFCLSKGLGAPVGSVLCGDRDWIDQARKYRKMLGGGLRQVGVLAAAGLLALRNIGRLQEDHEKARELAQGLAGISGISLDPESVQTNMVIFDVGGTGLDARQFSAMLAHEGVKCNAVSKTRIRMVTHLDVSFEEIREALRRIARVVRESGRPVKGMGYAY